MVLAWKACVRQRTGGSNPPLSAKFCKGSQKMITYEDMLTAWRNHCEEGDSAPCLEDPKNFYFNVFEHGDFGTIAIVTPKCLWDTEGHVCDQSTANLLMDKLEGYELQESVYDFDGENSESLDKTREYLISHGIEHNPSIEYPYN